MQNDTLWTRLSAVSPLPKQRYICKHVCQSISPSVHQLRLEKKNFFSAAIQDRVLNLIVKISCTNEYPVTNFLCPLVCRSCSYAELTNNGIHHLCVTHSLSRMTLLAEYKVHLLYIVLPVHFTPSASRKLGERIPAQGCQNKIFLFK